MALFAPTVPREMYDEMKARALGAEARLDALVKQFVDLKRHDHGMHPEGFDPTKADPMSLLGPQTQAAIDEECHGDPELRVYLRNVAIREYQKRSDDGDPEVTDAAVAAIIHEGED